jgi:hypothetical protein
MLKKKKCATKRGKWAMEYNVKVSVKPVKRKKKGGFATRRARVSDEMIKGAATAGWGIPDGSKVGKTVLYYQNRDETPHRLKRKRVSRVQGKVDKLKRPSGLKYLKGRYS